jgi:hypothetical protein
VISSRYEQGIETDKIYRAKGSRNQTDGADHTFRIARLGHSQEGSSRACGVYRTEAEAERAAREMLRIKGGAVRIQGPDGREHERFTIGRNAFVKVSAVEGIRLSDDMIRDLRDFDRKKLSDGERGHAIARKYGRKAT